MPVKMKPVSVIKANLGLEKNGKVQKFFTNTCAKHMDPFVPFDTGSLAETAWINNRPGPGVGINTITYSQKYAKVVYYGIRNGKKIHFHTDKHSKANSYWDKRMVSAKMDDIVKEVQDYIKRGAK